jgi:hypothetical protein
MRHVKIASHDAESYELYVAPENFVVMTRFSVLLPKASTTRVTLYAAASNLCAYVRLSVQPEPDVRWSRQGLGQAWYALTTWRRREAAAQEIRDRYTGLRYETFRDLDIGQRIAQERAAIEHARELLRSIDAPLLAKMESGYAFYFSTEHHSYIWYPSSRSIVSLDADAPHFVCVHSQDPAVEENVFDWALCMRTYLLGAETHWRATANFLKEYGIGGGLNAYVPNA